MSKNDPHPPKRKWRWNLNCCVYISLTKYVLECLYFHLLFRISYLLQVPHTTSFSFIPAAPQRFYTLRRWASTCFVEWVGLLCEPERSLDKYWALSCPASLGPHGTVDCSGRSASAQWLDDLSETQKLSFSFEWPAAATGVLTNLNTTNWSIYYYSRQLSRFQKCVPNWLPFTWIRDQKYWE